MMNRILKTIISGITLAAVSVSMCGCVINANSDEMEASYLEESVPIEIQSVDAEEEEPEKMFGTASVNGVAVCYSVMTRGDILNVTGEQEEYYISEKDGIPVYIEKKFVRAETEEPFTAYDAVLSSDADVFDNVYLENDSVCILPEGTTVTVADEFSGIQYVECEDVHGYITAGNAVIPEDTEKKISKSSSKKKSSSGSTSQTTESVTETPAAEEPGTGEDGGSLDAGGLEGYVQSDYLMLMASAPEEDSLSVNDSGVTEPFCVTVLGDGAELYAGFTVAGEEYEICGYADDKVSVVISGNLCTLPDWAILSEGETMPDPVVKYIAGDNNPYYDYKFRSPAEALALGSEVSVILEKDDFIIMTGTDGVTYYLKNEQSGILADEMPETESTEDNDTAKSSGSKSSRKSSSGSGADTATEVPSDSGGSAAEQTEEEIWTEEVL